MIAVFPGKFHFNLSKERGTQVRIYFEVNLGDKYVCVLLFKLTVYL